MEQICIWDVLCDLVPFVQFKKREKHRWRSVTFSKVAGLKVTLRHGRFSCFLNCTNGTKSRNASHFHLYYPEPYLEPYQRSLMELQCENSERLKVVNYLCKKTSFGVNIFKV